MPLLDSTGYIDDPYQRPAEGDALASGHLVPFARRAEAPAGAPLGVEVPATINPALLRPHFPRLQLIAIQMPAFTDGRAFSLARRLRRDGFTGVLRIVGPLIADQFPYALAVGVDQIELPEASAARQPAAQWQKAAAMVTLGYQRGLARASSILEQRRAARSGTHDA